MLITDAAVREAAVAVAQSLSGGWVVDPEAPADGAAHLVSLDGRGISFRPVFGGTVVQLWITGGSTPPSPADATPAEQAARAARLAVRLPTGQRYNMAANLVTENDEEPEFIIMRTLEGGLLPAFDYKPGYVGHRPWIDLFDKALDAAVEEADRASMGAVPETGGTSQSGMVQEPPQAPGDPAAQERKPVPRKSASRGARKGAK